MSVKIVHNGVCVCVCDSHFIISFRQLYGRYQERYQVPSHDLESPTMTSPHIDRFTILYVLDGSMFQVGGLSA